MSGDEWKSTWQFVVFRIQRMWNAKHKYCYWARGSKPFLIPFWGLFPKQNFKQIHGREAFPQALCFNFLQYVQILEWSIERQNLVQRSPITSHGWEDWRIRSLELAKASPWEKHACWHDSHDGLAILTVRTRKVSTANLLVQVCTPALCVHSKRLMVVQWIQYVTLEGWTGLVKAPLTCDQG